MQVGTTRLYTEGQGNGKAAGYIPALEDKLVPLASAQGLNAIEEQDFLDFSNGYRPQRRAHETVADLIFPLPDGW